jgi:hypothetical protein
VWVTTGTEVIESQTRCETKTEWFFIAEKLGMIDIVLTILVPFLIITVANLLISLKLMRSVIHRDQNAAQHDQSVNLNLQNLNTLDHKLTQTVTAKNKTSGVTDLNLRRSELRKRKRGYSKTTRMLLVISTVYIFLNAPLAFSKLRFLVANMSIDETVFSTSVDLNMTTSFDLGNISNHSASSIQKDYKNTATDELIERLTCYLYYLNFAINFLLYSFNGPAFLSQFMRLVKISCRKRETTTQVGWDKGGNCNNIKTTTAKSDPEPETK